MNCPACRDELTQKELEPSLPAHACNACDGAWLRADEYRDWREKEVEDTPIELELEKSKERNGAKFCPQCRFFLIKYKVGADLGFHIDRCGQCGGVWLDGNEWPQLKAANLHREIQRVFSQDWQGSVKKAEHAQAIESIVRNQLGDDFAEVARIKKWIEGHPKKPEILAYLMQKQSEHPARAK